jgi:hypothetical protein
MFKSHARRGILASLLVAGSLGIGAGVANAAVTQSHYQLTPREHTAACGKFQGTIIFGDGSGSIDCSSGVATFPVAS